MCLTRNDLPVVIHSGSRGATRRAEKVPANQANVSSYQVASRSDRRRHSQRHFDSCPACANRRPSVARPWEGDLIVGGSNCAIATVVEKSTRFTVLCKVKNKRAESVVPSLIEQMRRLPSQLQKSLTGDRGQELSARKRFSMDTNVTVYFCDPGCPWQRDQRKYELASTILSQGHRLGRLHAASVKRRRCQAELPPKKDFGIQNTARGAG